MLNQGERIWPIYGIADRPLGGQHRGGGCRRARACCGFPAKTVARHGAAVRPRITSSYWRRRPQPIYGVLGGSEHNALYLGCGTGLCLVQNGNVFRRWGTADGLPQDRWNRLYQDREGRLWLRGDKHIAMLNPKSRVAAAQSFPVPCLDTGQMVPSFTEDKTGRILTACGASLLRFENGRWEAIGEPNGLGKVLIHSVFADRDGSMWLGLCARGLLRWRGYGRWEHWTQEQGLRSNLVWAILRDRTGRLWLGDEGGLSTLEKHASAVRRVLLN